MVQCSTENLPVCAEFGINRKVVPVRAEFGINRKVPREFAGFVV
jgi:hypothetical protein